MKPSGWFSKDRFPWEESKEMTVFWCDRKYQDKLGQIQEIEKAIFSDFDIPMRIVNGNNKYPTFQTKMCKNVSSKIDSDEFVEKLNELRETEGKEFGVTLLLGKDVEPIDQHKYPDKPGIYGVGKQEGLIILRQFDRTAVKHELGHVLGLSHHDGDTSHCIMNWCCPEDEFCSDCRNEIIERWKKEISSEESL